MNKCKFCDKKIGNKSKRCLNCGQDIHLDTRYKNKEWLKNSYLINNLSSNDIAKICRASNHTIFYWLKKFQIPIKSASECQKYLIGKKHSSWKNGRRKSKRDGYIYLNIRGLTDVINPNTNKNYTQENKILALKSTNHPVIPEHRLLISIKYNKILTKEEHVHHINGIRDDNRIDNLILMSNSDHKKLGWTLKNVLQEKIRILESKYEK